MKNTAMKYFSKDELLHILLSILLLTLVISYPDLQGKFIIVLFTVLIYYLFKQPAHKWMAKKLHCTSTFKIWTTGVFATIFTIFLKIADFNLPILVPGSIEILPYRFGRKGIKLISMTPRDSAMISLAGIGTVMLLGIFFTLLPFDFTGTMASTIALLLLFDLLPIPQFDGGRIFTWHIFGWVVLIIISLLILLVF